MPSKRVLVLSVGITPQSERGVVIAQYSHYRSRMWAWNAKTLEVLGFQDLRGGARLLDTDSTGNLCAYHASASKGKEKALDASPWFSRRYESYVAISKPPYFTALWIRNAGCTGHAVRFVRDDLVRWWTEADRDPEQTPVRGRVESNCPIRFEASSRDAVEALGPPRVTDDMLYSRAAEPTASFDAKGREIRMIGDALCADGVSFIDMSRCPFELVTPPKWAQRW